MFVHNCVRPGLLHLRRAGGKFEKFLVHYMVAET